MPLCFSVNRRGFFSAGVLLLVGAIFSRADVSLAAVFSDHAVLQRDRPIPVWGVAAAGEAVEVAFAGQRVKTTADAAGHWQVTLAPIAANATPADLTAQAANTVTVHDLLVGDVWLCSGQSNMEKPIGEKSGQKPVFNAEEEIKAGDHPLIRLLKITKTKLPAPGKDIADRWTVCSPESLEKTKFSAVGYFFGRKIQQETNVPIGLIDSTWGGTRIEPWTPPEGFAAVPSLARYAAAAKKPGESVEKTIPSQLYYGMIQPLAPYALRGFLWYQGESNLIDVKDTEIYTDKMEALIHGWREVWHDASLPFYYTQIAPHFYHLVRRGLISSPESLPEFWSAQRAALRVPNTGIAATIDLVDDFFDIHPRNKQDVGLRLALLALARTYGRADVVDSGPVFVRWEAKDNQATVYFTSTAAGLASRDKKPLSWFEMAGEDGVWFPAGATIEADHVVVSTPRVQHPKAVRFAWDEAAQPNLVNSAGLPAWPFKASSPEQP